MLLIPYPVIDRVLFQIGPAQVRWYGLAYIFGILLGYRYGVLLLSKRAPNLFKDNVQFFDLAVGALVSMIVGGRVGHVVLYELQKYCHNPLEIFYIWNGGMAFHGALIGACIYGVHQSRKLNIPFFYLADIFAVCTPVGLFLGRLANFINQELVGRVTDVPWGMIFPGDTFPRHPSQLYEAFSEGILLLIILNACHKCDSIRLRPGVLFGIFVAGYGFFRSICEYFREPADFVVEWAGITLTSGQLYSIPMIMGGVLIGGLLWRHAKMLSSKS